jgi:hypothetical protein
MPALTVAAVSVATTAEAQVLARRNAARADRTPRVTRDEQEIARLTAALKA